MKPKDLDLKEKKSGIIYSFQCNHIACSEEYIGETARTLGGRCKEHLKQPSLIHAHVQQTGHSITDTSFNNIGREDQEQARTIKDGHICDRVLFNTPGLKLSSSQWSSAQT